jgi:hypothetical protein
MVSWDDQNIETSMIVPNQLTLDHIPLFSGGTVVIENVTSDYYCSDVIPFGDSKNIVNYSSLAL